MSDDEDGANRREPLHTIVGCLTPDDLGRVVEISAGGAFVRGRLTALEVQTDWIDEQDMANPEPSAVIGRVTATIGVGWWVAQNIPQDTHVEVRR